MKVLVQRVRQAAVTVDGVTTGEIARGILLFIGIDQHDDTASLQRMADKVLNYRVFGDADGRMNLSVRDVDGGVLAVSQFTLSANTNKGLRPSFSSAAAPAQAQALYQEFVCMLRAGHGEVACGVFAADMQVALVNDGPVTFLLAS